MGKIVSFDVDALAAKAKILGEEAPQLLSMLETVWPGAAKAGAFAPMLSPLASLMGKLAGGSDGLTGPGTPDTGPRGKGRMSYQRQRRDYDDRAVVKACEMVVGAGLAQSKTIADTVNYTLMCMYPDTPRHQWSDAQTRTAIDKILDDDGLSEGTCDKLGDMIYYALNKPAPEAGKKEG